MNTSATVPPRTDDAELDLPTWATTSAHRVRAALRPADVWALRLVALHLLPVAALVLSGWLYIDDLRAQAYAEGRSWWPFVVESNGTHLAPGPRTVDWLMVQVAPLEHWPAVCLTLLIRAGLGLAAWWLLRELVGARKSAVAALALVLLNAGNVPSTAWFRQALTTQVGLTFTLLAAAVTLRGLRRGQPGRTAAYVAALTASGVCFSERAVATVPLCAAAALLAVRGESAGAAGGTARRSPWWRRLLVVVPAGVVVAVFLVAYRSGAYDQGGGASSDWSNLPRLMARSLVRDILPVVLGGPWSWRAVQPSYAVAHPAGWWVTLTGLLWAAGLLLLLARRATRARTLRLLGVFAAYAVPLWVMLFLGRFATGGVGHADDLRLWPDLTTLLVVLSAGAALGPAPRQGTSPGTARRRPLRLLSVLLALVVVAGTTVSWIGFGRQWARNQAGDYVSSIQTDLGRTRSTVLSGVVPDSVVPGWVQADFSTGTLVRLLAPERAVSVADGPVAVVTDSGRLNSAEVRTVATSKAGARGFCGHGLTAGSDGWLHVPFARDVPYYRGSLLRVRLLIQDTTRLEVAVLDEHWRARRLTVTGPALTRGPHTLYLTLPYQLRVRGVLVRTDSRVGMCVPTAEVVLAGAAG